MNYIDKLLQSEDMVSPGISACQGCGAELILRTVLKIMGKNTAVVIPPGCMAGAGAVGWNFDNGLKVPVHISLLDNTASFMTGVKTMYELSGKDTKVVGIAGDGATSDCGFQSLSGAAERGENLIYICYDNEGYMNTGFQRSGTTSKGSSTSTTPVGKVAKGKEQNKKDLPMIMAEHDIAYTATLSPAYMQDFVRKVEKAASMEAGFRYLHVYSPCPTGWGSAPECSIELARKAVQTNFFPLFEVENNRYTINLEVRDPQPVSELIKQMGKFRHLTDCDIRGLQEMTDRKYDKLKALAAMSQNN
ncbi:MAG: thiamine pyrophosphate-dependent enzyme [Clostridiaceae bacterium]|nr:thiamine pyrophosphate-dependent enzyme [Clostridiaceae bacterium]